MIKIIKYLIVFMLVFSTFTLVTAEGNKDRRNIISKTTGSPQALSININNISTRLYNDLTADVSGGQSAFEFPKGSNAYAVYQSGFVFGAKVNGQIRTGGSTFGTSMTAGRVDANGVPVPPDAAESRMFRVRPDWETGSMKAEIDDGEGSEADIRAQYQKDLNEWPAQYGAPYEDVDGNGSYDPTVDIPGIPGADQTVYFIANDFDPAQAALLYGAPPFGVEIQVTVWGYKRTGALGNMIFKKYKFINKSPDDFEEMYVSVWNDPDVGGAGDDYVGIDTTTSLMYAYNADPDDDDYKDSPPASGFDFFQGPIVDGEPGDTAIFDLKKVPGKKNLGATSFYYFINSDEVYSDPELGDYNEGTLEMWNLLNGLIGPTGNPFPIPASLGGGTTKFPLSGDPVAQTGYIDGIVFPAGDRRAGMVSGPFTMAAGDTQEVVVAELAAGGKAGTNNLQAVSLLKNYDLAAQDLFDKLFVVPAPPPPPIVEVTELNNKIVLNWGKDVDRVKATETSNVEGYVFQGYNVYQLPSPSAQLEEATRLATFDIIDKGIPVKIITDKVIDPATGTEIEVIVQYGNDTGIERQFVADFDFINQGGLINGSDYYYAVTAYAYNEDLLANPRTLENTPIIFHAVPKSNDPGVRYSTEVGGPSPEVTHTGLADATIDVKIVDPTKLTGHDYQVFFNTQDYIRNAEGKWVFAPASTTFKVGDLTGSTIDMTAIYGVLPGTVEISMHLNNNAPNGAWIDGVILTFPAGIEIVSVPDFEAGGGTITPDINGQVVSMGLVNDELTQDGIFHGGEDWIVVLNAFTPPTSINYVLKDDGWQGSVVDVNADVNLSDIGFAMKTESHWNIKDVTLGVDIVEDITIVGGEDIYNDITIGENTGVYADGFEVKVVGSYDAPTTIASLELNGADLPIHNGGQPFDIIDFTLFGYPDSRASTTFPLYGGAGGTSSIDALQQDYELRWTGVKETRVINGQNVVVTASGGSIATLFGASGYDLADHPLNPAPGTEASFTYRIPFEVWNVTTNQQVNLAVWDRSGNITADPFNVWNYENRQYMWCVNTPYAEDVIDVTAQGTADNATWNWVIYKADYTVGDVVKINYPNPLQSGVDNFAFTAPGAPTISTELAKEDVKNINVFPNPYYGVNSLEINKYQRFVTFNHLPETYTIRIFNLAGQQVATIDSDSPVRNGQYQNWDLNNNDGLPVASGLYIAYIDMPDLGKTKILKFAIIQEQQILDRF